MPSPSSTIPPIAGPTVEPTVEPTAKPTVEPTAGATAEPTVEPTIEPTETPTATLVPSLGFSAIIIFIEGINSLSVDPSLGIDCDTQYESGSYWEHRERLRSQLPPELSDSAQIIGSSYRDFDFNSNGSNAWCDPGDWQRPKYERSDTCNGVAEASSSLDWLIGRLREQESSLKLDIVSHSMGGLVAAYWAAGGSETDNFLSEEPDFLSDHVHSIITLDAPLNSTQQFFNPTWVCSLDTQSVDDLQGSSAVVDKILEKDGQDSNVQTGLVDFVHINSTAIGDLLPGHWRNDPPPCRNVLDPTQHSCMLDLDGQLGAVASAVLTDVHDDAQLILSITSGEEWIRDFSGDSVDGWIASSALKTDDDTEASLRITGLRFEEASILYTGGGGATIVIDNEARFVLPIQGDCSEYEHWNDRSPINLLLRPQLCEFSISAPIGVHTIDIIMSMPSTATNTRRRL